MITPMATDTVLTHDAITPTLLKLFDVTATKSKTAPHSSDFSLVFPVPPHTHRYYGRWVCYAALTNSLIAEMSTFCQAAILLATLTLSIPIDPRSLTVLSGYGVTCFLPICYRILDQKLLMAMLIYSCWLRTFAVLIMRRVPLSLLAACPEGQISRA